MPLTRRGIVVSNGDLPKVFRFFSEILYKNKKVNWMIANHTITKGVNLKPDNIAIFTPNFTNNKNINIFELRNAIGRVGRYINNDLISRIGNVQLVAAKKTESLNKFSENFDKYTADSIEYIPNTSNEHSIVKDFKFEDKNIDWINAKFNIKQIDLEKWIIENAAVLKSYIEYKYSRNNEKTIGKFFDDVWETFVKKDELRMSFINSILSRKNYLYNYSPDTKINRFFLNTLKHQGFRETLRPYRTFIESAKAEFNIMAHKNEQILSSETDTNLLILALENGEIKGTSDKNNPKIIKSNIDINLKNDVLDALIMRKSKVWTSFVDSLLSPLDSIIANVLNINYIDFDIIDEFIEEENLPTETKRYLYQITKNKNGDLLDNLRIAIKQDEYIVAIQKVINMKKSI